VQGGADLLGHGRVAAGDLQVQFDADAEVGAPVGAAVVARPRRLADHQRLIACRSLIWAGQQLQCNSYLLGLRVDLVPATNIGPFFQVAVMHVPIGVLVFNAEHLTGCSDEEEAFSVYIGFSEVDHHRLVDLDAALFDNPPQLCVEWVGR